MENNKKEEDKKTKRPSLFWALTEGGRALLEFGSYYPYKALKKSKQSGDGHPVMVIPGFMASDTSTIQLRKFVHTLGYKGYGWGQGRNFASEDYIELLLDKLETIFLTHGQKVSLIGWSLGGVYARQLGKASPNMVRQIITLGSPFKGITESNNAKWLYDLLNIGQKSARIDPDLLHDIPLPAPVPTTAVYSKEDGVVPWKYCVEEIETEIHQNIQVRGSHLGLGFNPAVLNIIEDRLLYKEENWKSFESNSSFEDIFLYPSLQSA